MKPEIERIERLLPHLQRADFPWPAYRLFVDSRRLYNETRRTILPMRLHTLASVRAATAGLAPAQERAREAVELLARGGRSDLADNVRAWLRFVEDEAARCVPPAMPCPSGPTTGFVPLRHNHCFRRGESFVNDYLDFFEAPDYLQTTGLAFSVHRTAAALVVTLRERANDIPARLAYWEKMQSDANSSSFVMRVYLDPDGRGASHRTVIVWPRGESVSLDRLSGVKAATTFAHVVAGDG